ncbi:glycoside hydrolase family 95-like protein [Micromonospora sp. NPDC051296]|uniref:glycoside hydrolase family 95-like protein n=1 Tax=Micromonospora sp. NPDC051296 TaxID=3155046 RepID=UPI00343782E4
MIGSSAAAGATVVSGWAAPAAAGRTGSGPAAATEAGPTEQAVRDAALIWRTPPRDHQDGPFLGDGTLGAQVYCGQSGTELSFVLTHCTGRTTPRGLWRTPAATLHLTLSGTVTAVDWTLDLWDAQLSGTVTTTRGALAFTGLVHDGALLVWTAPSGGELDARWGARDAVSAPAVAPARSRSLRHLPAGDVAWQERRRGSRRLLAVAAGTDAASRVKHALTRTGDTVNAAHSRWWHQLYEHSFVALPAREIQRFYWAQIYKLGALGKAGVPARGGWRAWPAEQGDAWTAAWRELAARAAGPLLDAPMSTMDGLDAAALLEAGLPGMGSKAAPQASPLEAMHNLWLCARHSIDERLTRGVLHPMLRRAVERYVPFLGTGRDGRWHLPKSYSPGLPDTADATYHLSLLRWGATTLAAAEPGNTRWAEVLNRLAPYHRNADGVLIGARMPLRRSAPIPAHLRWIHPLREPGWDGPARSDVRRRSFATWAARRDGWQGHSFAAAASLAAALGDAGEALYHLGFVLRGTEVAGSAVRANTLYRQRSTPGLETPFVLANAVLDSLLSGTGQVVDVFPAVGPAWPEVSFAGLRAPGGFVVDAHRVAGHTRWVRVSARVAGTVTIRHRIPGELEVRDGNGRALHGRPVRDGIALTLAAEQVAVVAPPGVRPGEARQHTAAGSGRVWGLPG